MKIFIHEKARLSNVILLIFLMLSFSLLGVVISKSPWASNIFLAGFVSIIFLICLQIYNVRRIGSIALTSSDVKIIIFLLVVSMSTNIFLKEGYARNLDEVVETPFSIINLARAYFMIIALLISIKQFFSATLITVPFKQPHFTYLLFSIFAVVSSLWSPFPLATLGKSLELLILVVILISLIIYVSKSTSPLKSLSHLWDFILVLVLIKLLLLWFFALLYPDVSFRNTGGVLPQLFGTYASIHPNTSGFLGMLLALTGISRFFSSPKLQKNFSQIILFILVGAITTLFSQARTSIISLYIGFLFLIVINQKSRIPVIFLFISVSVFILWGLNDGFLMDFFRRGQVDENFYSLSGRLFHWSNSLDLLRSSPIIGTSYYSGIRFTLTSEYYGSFTNLDNTFIETLYSLGIIGFILISSYFVRIWISLFTKLGIGRVTGFHHLSIEFLLIFFMINLHAFFGPTIETAGITTLLCFPLLIYASANSKYLNNR